MDLRDSVAALPFAIRANEMTGQKNPGHLDALSLAYHLTGDTAKAIENQKKAISLLPADANRGEYEAALAKFEAALPTEQEAVASDKPGQIWSDEKQDELVRDHFDLDRVPVACFFSARTAKQLSVRI